jgi:hypothetical protein
MKTIFLFFILLFTFIIAFAQLPETQIKYAKHSFKFEKRLHSNFPYVQIAQWKNNYLISYVDENYHTHVYSTADFKTYTKTITYSNEIIWDIETKGNQIAILYSPTFNIKDDHDYRDVFIKTIDEKGAIIKKTKILGDADMKKPLAYCIDNIGSRYLRWENNHYVAFFAIMHNFAEKSNEKPDVHQGQTEIYIDKNLNVLTKEIDWGVSHSFEQRIDVSQNYTLKVAKGDGYPRGIHYSVQNHILEQDEDDFEYSPEYYSSGVPMLISGSIGENYVDLVLGDVYINDVSKKVNIVGTTRDKRKSADIFYINQDFDGKKNQPEIIWLTNTASVEEHSVRMFPYKEGTYLLIWKEYPFTMTESENEAYNDKLENEAIQDVFLYKEVDAKQKVKVAIINKKGEFVSKPTVVDLNINIVIKDVAAPNDYLNDLLENFSIFFSDFLIEEKRIIMPFYYPWDTEITFFEILK